jgi:hypothetical protein
MAACIFSHINAVPPRPDVTHPTSALYGVAKRMAYKPKRPNKKLFKAFRCFVRKWLIDNLEPLDTEEMFDFEEWLSGTNYTDKRKQELRKAWEGVISDELLDSNELNINAKVKYFVKEEWYPEYKHFRGIWAREDAFKAICGPFFKKIEEALFKLPYFIKKIPKDKRADYIMDFMYNPVYLFESTDFTAYESHFTTYVMYYCERELYKHMVRRNLQGLRLLRLIFHVIANFNYVINKYFTLAILAKRMSGEMNTSLGNGFSNLMLLLFACFYYKIDFTGPVVEGDDGLLGLSREIPPSYFVDMGFNVKMILSDISHASFCGMIFDPEERINITDPRKPLCTIMWVPRKYASASQKTIKGLIKSKALSLIFEYPGCPILCVLGAKLFSLLSGVEMINIGQTNYEKKRFNEILLRYANSDIPVKPIGPRSRDLMEHMFGISVQQQLLIEADIERMTLDNWDTNSALLIMPELWVSNYNNYVVDRDFTIYDINHFYGPGTVNKYLDDLPLLRNNGPVKHKVGKLIDFNEYRTHSKFQNITVMEVFEYYKQYYWDFWMSKYILYKCLSPIHFGSH